MRISAENWKLNNKEPNENPRAEKYSIGKQTSMDGFNDTVEKTKERMIWKISRMKQLHTIAASSPCLLHTMQSTKNVRDTEDRKTNISVNAVPDREERENGTKAVSVEIIDNIQKLMKSNHRFKYYNSLKNKYKYISPRQSILNLMLLDRKKVLKVVEGRKHIFKAAAIREINGSQRTWEIFSIG